jgi:protein-disulfide isomerase
LQRPRGSQTRSPDRGTETQQLGRRGCPSIPSRRSRVELFYHEQGEENSGYVTESYLQGLAQQVPGLNLIAWTVARNDTALVNTITTDAQAANSAGFTGTPSFLLGKTGGRLQSFRQATDAKAAPYDAAIENLLKG